MKTAQSDLICDSFMQWLGVGERGPESKLLLGTIGKGQKRNELINTDSEEAGFLRPGLRGLVPRFQVREPQ